MGAGAPTRAAACVVYTAVEEEKERLKGGGSSGVLESDQENALATLRAV